MLPTDDKYHHFPQLYDRELCEALLGHLDRVVGYLDLRHFVGRAAFWDVQTVRGPRRSNLNPANRKRRIIDPRSAIGPLDRYALERHRRRRHPTHRTGNRRSPRIRGGSRLSDRTLFRPIYLTSRHTPYGA